VFQKAGWSTLIIKFTSPPCTTPKLSAINLSKYAADGKLDPIIGRDEEIERAIQVLSRKTKNNPCLIGEPGVGKVWDAHLMYNSVVF
jgi:ATP-dependent Clp protease ATP-binding subunit ClpC